GIVTGWYVLHGALFCAAAVGLATGELPLFEVVDRLTRETILEPAGVIFALATLAFALASPSRRGAQRRATAWALVAILIGLGPTVASHVLPTLATPIDGTMTIPRLALAVLIFLGLTAVAALPLVNPLNRDLQAHALSQRLLDDDDLRGTLAAMAAVLRSTFEAEGVAIRLTTPRLSVS